ncbi:MAG: PilN domain-containing protein [Actinomycetota bacterium]
MKINLLPPEVGERQKLRRRTVMSIVIGVVVVGLIGGFFFLQVVRLSGVEEDIDTQEASNAALRAQIAELQDVASLEQEIATTRQLLSTLLQDRILWSGVLRDISLVIPGELWLDGLTGQVGTAVTSGDVATTAPTTTEGLVGQIAFTGFAFDHREVAEWLSRLEDIRGFINPWLSSSTKSEIAATSVVQFVSSVDLSDQALARRNGSGQ